MTRWLQQWRTRKKLEDEVRQRRAEVHELEQSYEADLKEAMAAKDWNRAEEVRTERFSLMRFYQEPLRAAETRLWVARAADHLVSVPRDDDTFWYECEEMNGRHLLSDRGIIEVQKRIREEKRTDARERRATVAAWAGLLGAMAGIAAAATGFLAIWRGVAR